MTTKDITRYYEFVAAMGTDGGELGPRPLTLHADGEKMNWNMCNKKYCVLSEICDRTEKSGYAEWLLGVMDSDKVREIGVEDK